MLNTETKHPLLALKEILRYPVKREMAFAGDAEEGQV